MRVRGQTENGGKKRSQPRKEWEGGEGIGWAKQGAQPLGREVACRVERKASEAGAWRRRGRGRK